jgi:hypothetical protein
MVPPTAGLRIGSKCPHRQGSHGAGRKNIHSGRPCKIGSKDIQDEKTSRIFNILHDINTTTLSIY